MASIRRRNGRFQAQVRMLGEIKTATFVSLSDANKWATLTEADLIAYRQRGYEA